MFHPFANSNRPNENGTGINPYMMAGVFILCIVAFLGWNRWNRYRRGLTYTRGNNELELTDTSSSCSGGAIQVQEGDGQWQYRAPAMDAPAESFRSIT